MWLVCKPQRRDRLRLSGLRWHAQQASLQQFSCWDSGKFWCRAGSFLGLSLRTGRIFDYIMVHIVWYVIWQYTHHSVSEMWVPYSGDKGMIWSWTHAVSIPKFIPSSVCDLGQIAVPFHAFQFLDQWTHSNNGIYLRIWLGNSNEIIFKSRGLEGLLKHSLQPPPSSQGLIWWSRGWACTLLRSSCVTLGMLLLDHALKSGAFK